MDEHHGPTDALSGAIDRRSFLAGALGLSAAVSLRPLARHLPAAATAHPRATTSGTLPAGSASATGRTLVLVTLYGGMDGLSAVVPYGDPAYYRQRGQIALPAASLLPIGNGLGFHPSLKNLSQLYAGGHVAIVRGVGYPDPNYSHFSSMDIWQSADPSAERATGWLGRWLDGTNADAMSALSLGSNVPLAFVGARRQASSIVASTSVATQLPPGGSELRSWYEMLERHHRGRTSWENAAAEQASSMLSVSNNVAGALQRIPAPTKSLGSAAGSLGTQLAVVSQLIGAELPTRVYGVSLGGFDSHAGEQASYTPLFSQLDSAVGGFFNSIAGYPNAAGTVMVIYSEFGRRVVANASGGSDHGAANDLFVIGPAVKGGVYGDEPSLTQLDPSGSLVASTDFRSVYATLLDQVVDVEPSAVLGSSWPEIAFV